MSKNIDTDIVVIGSGATGLAAALTAAESGAKVVVFEKHSSLGGTSNFFHGVFAVESQMQRERYITYSRDEAFKNIMEYSHWRANPRLVRAIIDESASTISWLQDQGVVFTDATINMPDAPRTYHLVKGEGAAVIKALTLKAKEKGVNTKSGVPVMRITKQGNRVTGVVVKDGEEEIRVGAKAVVVSSGGYANNKDWIKKYTGYDIGVNVFPVGNADKMGDGIRMAWEVGAADEGMGVLHILRIGPIHPAIEPMSVAELPALQPDLWVDSKGLRFCNEGLAFYDTSLGNISARYKEGYTFSIFDDSILQRLQTNGMIRNVHPQYPPGTWPPEFDQTFKHVLDNAKGEVFSADTIDGLALQAGIAPEVLKNTIDEYNNFCQKGHDDLFAKKPEYLWPLMGKKFYAMKAHTAYLGTLGGIKVNQKMEVVDKKDDPIPGLYAGGMDIGGMWGDSYCMDMSSGLSSAVAINSGRIAGRNALIYVSRIKSLTVD